MIQVNFDPSSLMQIKEDVDLPCNIVSSITGVSWKAGVAIPATLTGETAKNTLYPWRWNNDLPEFIRVYWLKLAGSKYEVISYDDLKYEPASTTSTDRALLVDHFEYVVNERIFSKVVAGELISSEIEMDYSQKNATTIEIGESMTVPDTTVTGFFTSAISQFAQRLAPLNEQLGLVFFHELKNLKPPTGTVAFTAFPLHKTATSRWSIATTAKPTLHKEDHFILEYNKIDTIARTGYSPVTLLPKISPDSPIKLRDKEGNFLGIVEVGVSDCEAWESSVVSACGKFFDLPRLFEHFLHKNKAHLIYKEPNPAKEYLDWVTQLNDFLFCSMRDASGFGHRTESDGVNMLQRVAIAYCNVLYPEIESLGYVAQKEYWQLYEKVNTALNKKLATELDPAYKIDVWKTTFGKIVRDARIKLDANILELVKQLNFVAPDLPGPGKNEPVINGHVTKWLDTWHKFLRFLQDDHVLQQRIMYAQWEELTLSDVFIVEAILKDKIPEYDKMDWLEKIFSEAGEPRVLQKEAISEKYKFETLDSAGKGSLPDVDELAKDCNKAMIKYIEGRIDAGQQEFFPIVSDPFSKPPIGISLELSWTQFLLFVKTEPKPAGAIKPVIVETIQSPTPTPARLQLRVDNSGSSVHFNDKDDLNDEIAGHIVLMKRSHTMNVNDLRPQDSWRYLNWARVQSIKANNIVSDFVDRYLVPAFVPENNNHKTEFLELDNEKLSLVAGHETFADGEGLPDDINQKATGYFKYQFDHFSPGLTSAYALWYGYHYGFHGFVSLNSGVLPTILRDGQHLNVPTLSPVLVDNIKTYRHFRRVPVSKLRVEALQIVDGKEKNIGVVPKEFMPLAFELPEWKSNLQLKPVINTSGTLADGYHDDEEPAKVIKTDQSYYLLADELGGKNNYIQKAVKLKLRKPTTSFWNWYAWLGQDANKPYSTSSGITTSFAKKALEAELAIRDRIEKDPKFNGEGHLCDPAVDQKILVIVDRLFPDHVEVGRFFIDFGISGYLDDPMQNVTVSIGNKRTISGSNVTIMKGDVVRLQSHALIPKQYFDQNVAPLNNQKFHNWMKDVMCVKKQDGSLEEFNDCYLTQPVESWFEAATPLSMNEEDLWTNLEVGSEEEKVFVMINKHSANYSQMAYGSRMEVKHQVWSWNGRLDNSDLLIPSLAEGKLDPVRGTLPHETTLAMRWEAWAFSDRPDFSTIVHETNVSAERVSTPLPGPIKQVLFTDGRPGEERAIYYRFTATLHCRYESLGPAFISSTNAAVKVDGVPSPWKRYLRKCTLSKQLPKPSIRFIIPLTKSIKESGELNKIYSAPLLVVLNDRWFSQAGLAERLKIGIDKVETNSDTTSSKGKSYLLAGNDPILSGEQLGEVLKKGEKFIFKPEGPVGFTFDFAAQTPRLLGCGFVLHVPDLSTEVAAGTDGDMITNQLKPWSMMQIGVRRELQPEFCEKGVAVPSLNSEWTAKEWVQFLPAIDSFIPGSWRKKVSLDGHIALKKVGLKITFEPGDKLPVFDDVFEERMQRFAIITEKVYDIGGQPSERYLATYKYDLKNGEFTPDVGEHIKDFSGVEFGYVRLMLVRSYNDNETEPVWKRLFGESAVGKTDMSGVENDPTAAIPLISERVSFKIE